MPRLRDSIIARGVLLAVLGLHGGALSAEPASREGAPPSSQEAARSSAQSIEAGQTSLNEAWRKLTDPKTTESVKDMVNEGWRRITDPNSTEPVRRESNRAWKGLSEAARGAVGSSTSWKGRPGGPEHGATRPAYFLTAVLQDPPSPLTPLTAASSVSGLTGASALTTTDPFTLFKSSPVTPGTCLSAASTEDRSRSHNLPPSTSVTVCSAARAGLAAIASHQAIATHHLILLRTSCNR